LLLLVVILLVPVLSHAGTADPEFQPLLQKLLDWVGGYLGKSLAIGALIVGLGIALAQQTLMPALVGLGVALIAAFGPQIITGLVTATF
jgi:conjugal transfer pilus assembly protein TraA